MTSQARIDANRRNALKSTGPRTSDGKNACRLNALWHGAFATDLFLPGENAADFTEIRDGLLNLYHPASPAEELLVRRLTLTSWRLERLAAMESRVLRAHVASRARNTDSMRVIKDAMLGRVSTPEEDADDDPGPSDSIALAWIRDTNHGNALAKLARYQISLEHSFYRALKQLQLLHPATPNPGA